MMLALLAMIAGGALAVLFALMSEILARRANMGDRDAEEFTGTLSEVLSPVRTFRQRIRRRSQELH
jgi:hypothetical protein